MRGLALVVVVIGCSSAPSRPNEPQRRGPDSSTVAEPVRPADAGAQALETVPADSAPEAAVATAAPAGKSAPLPASGRVTGVAAVRVGSFVETHGGCIRRTDGTVACWAGPNLLLHFDRGRTQPMPGPTPIAGVADAIALEIGGNEHCARVKSGGAVCWSYDGPAGALPFATIVEIAVAGNHMCVLLGDGTVQCKGKNYNGELGYEPFGYEVKDWAPVPGATNIAHIAGGAGVCGLRTDGTLYCWGAYPFHPPTKTRDEFTKVARPGIVAGISGVKRMALAGMPCLVFAKDVRCVREPADDKAYVLETAQLGIAVADIVDLDVSSSTVCAVSRAGKVGCWGPPPRPYVMDGADLDKMMRHAYNQARVVPGISDAVQISMGETHACVTTRAGNARCWGDNEYGQLGDGALGKRKEPTWVSWFHPALMPGPGEGLYGCRPAAPVQRACKAMAGDCALEPPPEYWSTGPGGGIRCDDDCGARIHAELKRLAVPACMCTCSDEYKQLEREAEARRPNNPPPSAAPGATGTPAR